jgi:IS30 family transposase
MTYHDALTVRTGVQVYFADPHSPWQRGSNENTNGLLRQYMPKGTDLSVYSQDELNQIALSLNTRPRARHQFRAPLEVYNEHLRLAEARSGTLH